MREQVTMKRQDETVTVSFLENNAVQIEHSHESKSRGYHEFDTFKQGRSMFVTLIGALYLDGYR